MRRTDADGGRDRYAIRRPDRTAQRDVASDEQRGAPTDERAGRPGERGARLPTSVRGLLGRLPHPLSMTVRDGLFVHWPVDPDALRPHVPDPLELDTHDGRAWVSIVPLVLARVGLRGTPSILRGTFPECNVRTYVRYRGDPALLFFSIDVGSAVLAAAARRLTRLPVSHSRMHVGGVDGQVAFASSREPADAPARLAVTYRPAGEVFYPEPGTLASWLVERRRFYAARAGSDVLTAEIAHAPWPLQPANVSVHENTLFAANDLPAPAGGPTAHYCEQLRMTGSIPRRASTR